MSKNRIYTKERKQEVLLLLLKNRGNVHKTSEDSGVPRKTIRRWRDAPLPHEAQSPKRTQKALAHNPGSEMMPPSMPTLPMEAMDEVAGQMLALCARKVQEGSQYGAPFDDENMRRWMGEYFKGMGARAQVSTILAKIMGTTTGIDNHNMAEVILLYHREVIIPALSKIPKPLAQLVADEADRLLQSKSRMFEEFTGGDDDY